MQNYPQKPKCRKPSECPHMKNSVVIKNRLGLYQVVWSNLRDVLVVKREVPGKHIHVCSPQVLTGKSNGGPWLWWRRGEARATAAEEVRASSTTEDQSPRMRPHLSFTPPEGRVHSLPVGRERLWQQIQTPPSPSRLI